MVQLGCRLRRQRYGRCGRWSWYRTRTNQVCIIETSDSIDMARLRCCEAGIYVKLTPHGDCLQWQRFMRTVDVSIVLELLQTGLPSLALFGSFGSYGCCPRRRRKI